MTTKEVAQICGVTEKTVRENAKTFGKVFENGKQTEWTEEELKKVQLVLMKNAQNNNTNASEQVKEACTTVFQLGTLANVALTSGNIEAAEQFSKLLMKNQISQGTETNGGAVEYNLNTGIQVVW